MTSAKNEIQLLTRDEIIKTGDVDEADWNFHPLLGFFQRKRFQIVAGLLSGRRYSRILEIGYGSGIFMPELARRCEGLSGLDIHSKTKEVAEVLRNRGVDVTLKSGTAEAIPFGDSSFDAVVAVSSMEYVHDIEAACVEITRVLTPGGAFVLITPGYSIFLDVAVKALTGESAKQHYGDRRHRLVGVVKRHFTVSEEINYSTPVLPAIKMYTALKLCRKSGS